MAAIAGQAVREADDAAPQDLLLLTGTLSWRLSGDMLATNVNG
jgi:hypothetical protein